MAGDETARSELERELGALVVAFSEVELRLQQLVWSLLGDEDSGQIVTATTPFRNLHLMAKRLWESVLGEAGKKLSQDPGILDEIRKRDPKAKDAIDYVFRRLRTAEETRNTMLHSWWPEPEEPYWQGHPPPFRQGDAALRWKGGNRDGALQPHVVAFDEIRAATSEFGVLASELATLSGVALGFHQRPESDPDSDSASTSS